MEATQMLMLFAIGLFAAGVVAWLVLGRSKDGVLGLMGSMECTDCEPCRRSAPGWGLLDKGLRCSGPTCGCDESSLF